MVYERGVKREPLGHISVRSFGVSSQFFWGLSWGGLTGKIDALGLANMGGFLSC